MTTGTQSPIKPIHTKRDYESALKIVEDMLDRENAGSVLTEGELNLLEIYAILIEKYEDEKYILPDADPVEAIRFRMEQMNLKKADLIPYLGAASRVSEIMSGKRKLTVEMIAKLHKGLSIPLESLVRFE